MTSSMNSTRLLISCMLMYDNTETASTIRMALNSSERSLSCCRLMMAVSPARVCMVRNSAGWDTAGTHMSKVMRCAMNAVRLSMKIRMNMGVMQYGSIYGLMSLWTTIA